MTTAGEREHQTRVVGLARAALVARLDRAEQLAAERQLDRALDLVEHDRDRGRRVREHDVPEEIGEATLARDGGALSPPARQVDVQAQLVHDAVRDRICPALDIGIIAARPEIREADDGDELPVGAQGARGARQQARLARAVRPEHVAKTTRSQRCVELFVGSTHDIRGAIRRNRTADHEKLCRLHDLGHGAEIVAAARR